MLKRKCVKWDSPGIITLSTEEVPDLADGEVLLKVESCAICGSDLRILQHGNSRVKSGQIIGHEISGTICQVTPAVKNWKVGDRVSVGADVPCGICMHCLSDRGNCCDTNYAIGHQFEGGFSEYMVLNKLTLDFGPVHRIKSDTLFDHAALAEPLACCLNGYDRVGMEDGKTVAIFGAGPIGLMLGLLAFTYQSPKVFLIDPINARLSRALDMSAATHTYNPNEVNVVDEIMNETSGVGVDVVFTACPVVETHQQAIQIVAKRGVVNFFGGLPTTAPPISLSSNFIHYREASITGSHGSTPAQHARALDLIESGMLNVGKLITHKFSLNNIHEAYKTAGSGEGVKILINPNSSDQI